MHLCRKSSPTQVLLCSLKRDAEGLDSHWVSDTACSWVRVGRQGMAVLSAAGSAQLWMFLESRCPMPHTCPEPYSEPSEVFNTYIYIHTNICIYIHVDGYGSTYFLVLHFSDLRGWTLREVMCCYVNIENSIA